MFNKEEYMKKYRENHKEHLKEYGKEWNKKYYLKHKDHIKERVKKYRKKHLKQIRENHRKYYQENKKQFQERLKKVKQKYIDILGGKCQICSYEKYIGALEFHHLNPKDKENTYERVTKAFERKIKDNKIQLLCANCHREKHHKETVNFT